MVLQQICSPALIYLVFSVTQIVIDTFKGMYNIAFIKLWVALIFTILLNFLCNKGLGIISWIIVFIPFILMTVIVTMLLLMFGLDPLTGRRPRITVDRNVHHRKHHRHHRHHRDGRHRHHGRPKYLDTDEFDRRRKYKESRGRGFVPTYDKTHEISRGQKQVLDDMVHDRTDLNKDPLHQ